jgi:hypothetical protein
MRPCNVLEHRLKQNRIFPTLVEAKYPFAGAMQFNLTHFSEPFSSKSGNPLCIWIWNGISILMHRNKSDLFTSKRGKKYRIWPISPRWDLNPHTPLKPRQHFEESREIYYWSTRATIILNFSSTYCRSIHPSTCRRFHNPTSESTGRIKLQEIKLTRTGTAKRKLTEGRKKTYSPLSLCPWWDSNPHAPPPNIWLSTGK